MSMIEVKAAELSGAALDWAMAKAEGWIDDHNSWLYQASLEEIQEGDYHPSTDPARIGPLIEKHGVAVRRHSSGCWFAMFSRHLGNGENCRWSLNRLGERYGSLSYQVHRVQARFEGPTLGTAVCRAVVAEVLGDVVQVPAELSETPRDSPAPEQAAKPCTCFTEVQVKYCPRKCMGWHDGEPKQANHKAALEDIAAVLRQSPEWGADQLDEIVAILSREGFPVSE